MLQNKASRILLSILAAACMIYNALPAQAKVSVEEAARLKKDLTPYGAERAGNADGTIPAWEGGLTGIPDNVNYDPSGNSMRPDPFADDKVLFTITAANMDQYADKLTPGLKELFKRYPDTWKMNIYPSRRTFSAPQYVYDHTYLNAIETELIGDGSDGFTGGFGGMPFPIPKNGAEVIMNHLYRYPSKGFINTNSSYLVYADGSREKTGGSKTHGRFDFWIGEREDFNPKGFSVGLLVHFTSPARRKGEILLIRDRTDFSAGDRGVWQYMPGQRRVRRAPSIAYDTPAPSYGGLGTYDDGVGFNGQIDRFDWNLKGKKEMFIPYNDYQFELAPIDDLLTPFHPNPEHIRWELHRVWVNEATLKEGIRHCYGRRVYFQDEDSWIVTLVDCYDTRGTLWRTRMQTTKNMYEIPSLISRGLILLDFQVDTYAVSNIYQGEPAWKPANVSDEFMSPQSVRKLGKR